MKPPRFTLKALLVIVTLAAVGLWVWRVNYSPRPVSEIDVQAIEVGHSQWQVRYLLGPPRHVREGECEAWGYDLEDSPLEYANFVFSNGRVTAIERHSYVPWLQPQNP